MSNSKPYRTFEDGQVARAIYLRMMSGMKEILTLGEMRIGARDSDVYKYFKKVVMDQYYLGMADVFEALERDGILQKCPCGTTIRQGYKTCPKCNGAGHCNTEDFDLYIEDGRAENKAQFLPTGLNQDSIEGDEEEEQPPAGV